MSKLTEQLREALTPDEQGNIHLSHEILASIHALLTEHEKLEREAEAGKALVKKVEELADHLNEGQDYFALEALNNYRQAVEQKEV